MLLFCCSSQNSSTGRPLNFEKTAHPCHTKNTRVLIDLLTATRAEQIVIATEAYAFVRQSNKTTHVQVNLLEMSNAEVEAFLIGMGEPKYRAKQVCRVPW